MAMFPCAVQYILSLIYFIWIFPVAQTVKNLLAMQEAWVQSPGWEDPMEKVMAIPASILPREFYGQRNLAGYSPWGHKDSNMTEQLHSASMKCTLSLVSLQLAGYLSS